MRGFEAERAAARAAVESLGYHPVMAEQFPSQDRSSQAACVDEVARSDCYVGILGERYGFVTGAGVSVTEEEYLAAQRRGLPILFFVKRTIREAFQEDFIRRVGGYESGFFFGQFSTDAELVAAVTKALTNLAKERVVQTRGGSAERVRKLLDHPATRGDRPCLRVAVAPVDQREYVDPVRMGERSCRDQLLQAALFGAGAIFTPELASGWVDGREYVSLKQSDLRNVEVHRIDVHTDGAILLTLSNQPVPRRSALDGVFTDMLVDQDYVADRLGASIRYVACCYQTILNPPRPTRAVVQVSLANIEGKKFGRRPSRPVTSWSHSFTGADEDVVVPSEPVLVPMAELSTPDLLVKKIVTLIERVFRESGSYFEADAASR